MKLIEALKEIQMNQKKSDDLREKIARHSAHLNMETPVYSEQNKQVREWLQAHSDILKEIMKLRISIQRTNLATDVVIELGGKAVTKTIAEWIHRRRDLARLEMSSWVGLTDKNLKEGNMQQSTGELVPVKIIRCYDPKERDEMVDLYTNEPTIIDSRLEVVNAITDLI